jgi:hypothetical protein
MPSYCCGIFPPFGQWSTIGNEVCKQKMLIQIVRYVLKTFMFISVVSNGGNQNRWIWIAAE